MAVTTQQFPKPAHELYAGQGQLPKLRSNSGEAVDASRTGWLKCTPIDTPVEEMRRRYEEDGYVWVKNVIPREVVLDMRGHYFKQLAPGNILKPGTSPRDGIFNDALDPLDHHGIGPVSLPSEQQVELLNSAHCAPEYLKFLEHQSLRSFIREFMQWEKEVMLTRTLLRHNVPGGLSTGCHYDRLFLRGGEAEFLTGWVPIGDTSADGGGLMYLEGSTGLGKAMERDFSKRSEHMPPEERISAFNANMSREGHLTHDMNDFMDETYAHLKSENEKGRKMRWLVGNFEAGDVVFHNPYIIHAASRNEDPLGRIRLATDLRFYEEGAPLDKRWLKVFRTDDGL